MKHTFYLHSTKPQLSAFNIPMMKTNQILFALFAIFIITLLSACGSSSTPEDPMAQLSALKDQRASLESQIQSLEADLEAQGILERKLRFVSLAEMKPVSFKHFIDLQGQVDADESVAATSKMPGVLKRIHIRNGDQVKRGQLLAELDDAVMRSSLAELDGQLAVATDLYLRQQSLWEQSIGSEVQYIQAKNNKESLERSISTLKENLSMTRILAPTSGVIDLVLLKQGQAISPGIPLCNIVNLSRLKIVGSVTEAYAAKVKRGDKVQVYFPDMNKEIVTTVTHVSKTINPTNRTFAVECALGAGDFRVNQIAVMKIVDYHNPSAITVPVNLIQAGEEGDYIMVAEPSEKEGEAVARRVTIRQGQNYNGVVEILSGLKEGDKVIATGFQDVNTNETVLY